MGFYSVLGRPEVVDGWRDFMDSALYLPVRLQTAQGCEIASDRKKPGAMFWVIAVPLIALLYPISFGPACAAGRSTESGRSVVSIVYFPLLWAADASSEFGKTGEFCDTLVKRYSVFFGKPGPMPVFNSYHGDVRWTKAAVLRF